ncbi:Peptidase, M20/M25/M40 family [Labilithrix luteola]|uniref:Peptidase, M20/M25/M40 family n=1 Tax=Labilithrix luteola TaxID=1391654 RepID=A0A0K1PVD3_9BACT|nr:M28 family peptidase [Labilithrix luteola]AKU97326.1 Peptidase, M20/M25/M40 family [Labilithrix luteola]
MSRALGAVLLAFAVVFAAAWVRYSPPRPLPASAPPERFSAERARELQRAIAGDGVVTRAQGTPGHERAKGELVDALSRLGLNPEVQHAFVCGRHGSCGFVENVVARRAGSDPNASAVALMAHYDSAPASPGASDDGVGVAAVIEAARALSHDPPQRRPVVIVLTDGEESGLLGAEAFAQLHPLAKSVRSVVNVDARGSHGPSNLFETSTNNAWLVGLAAKNLERPVSSSLFYEVYRRMPNDTDFTVMKATANGVNFANLAGIDDYHTPLDSIANADIGTLQHHGEQVLAMARALGESTEAEHPPAGDATWFDVLSLFIVRWPAGFTLPLALAALALVVGQAIRMRAFGAKGLFASLATLGGGALATVAAGLAMKASGALAVPWIAHPAFPLAALHGAALFGGLSVAAATTREATPRGTWAGTWILWSLLGVGAAYVAPGTAYLFVVPALAAGLTAWLPIEITSGLAAVVAGILWLPLDTPIYDAIGFIIPPVIAISTIVLLSALPPLLRGLPRAVWIGMGVVTCAAIGVATLQPLFSTVHPQRANVLFRQDEDAAHAYVQTSWGTLEWGSPPRSMLESLGPLEMLSPRAPLPVSLPCPSVETTRITVAAPALEVEKSSVENGHRHVRIRLRSLRGATSLLLVFGDGKAPRNVVISSHGQVASSSRGWLVLRGIPTEGLEVDMTADGPDPIDLTLMDVTPGVPKDTPAAKAVDARRALEGVAVPFQEGDITIATKHARL